MTKLFLGILAVVGGLFLMNTYFPGAWSHTFALGQHKFSYALPILGCVGYLAFFAKSK
jgi:hypothetical protein